MDIESYIQSLLVSDPLRESTLRAMIEALQLPKGSRGLDAGCGIGLQCLLLTEEVGLTGHVTCLGVSAEMLERGYDVVSPAGILPSSINSFATSCNPSSINFSAVGRPDLLSQSLSS